MPNEYTPPLLQCITEAENMLQSMYKKVCANGAQIKNTEILKINPPLDENEAYYFLQGLKEFLYEIDDEGYAQSSLLPPASGTSSQQKMLQLFWHRGGKRFLFREGLCQLATVSSLILEYGWDKDHILMEPSVKGFEGIAYAVDIIIKDKKGKPIIAVEVKKDAREFNKLLESFHHCCQRGAHKKDECDYPQNHAKYEFCSKIKPSYFCAVAPSKKVCYRLSYSSQSIQIEEALSNPVSPKKLV